MRPKIAPEPSDDDGPSGPFAMEAAPHDHFCLVYDGPEQRLEVVVPFLREGLELGERCTYISGDGSAAETLEALANAGVDVSSALESRALQMLDSGGTYVHEGDFDPDRMLGVLAHATQEALDAGFSALRVVGEASWAVGEPRRMLRLVEYESRVNDLLPTIPCLALCLYDRSVFPDEALEDTLRTHPSVQHGGRTCRNNPYLTHPTAFVRPSAGGRALDERLTVLTALAGLEEAKRELEKSEARYRTLFHSIRDAILVGDADRTIIDCNQAFVELFGYARGESLGKRTSFVYADEGEFRRMGEALHEHVGDPGFVHAAQYRTKMGTVFKGETSICPLKGDSGAIAGYVGVIRDVTESVRREEDLRQAQKTAEIGRFAGGIAHDFNNMLSVILGHTELLMTLLNEGDPGHADAQAIDEAAKRSADLTANLLALSRRQVTEPRVVDLLEIVRSREQLLRRLIGEHIVFTVTCSEDDAWTVRADPSQLDQVLMNLAANARDAIGGAGRIDVRLANHTIDQARPHEAAPHEAAPPDAVPPEAAEQHTPGVYVRLSFHDTGEGMDTEVLTRVFDPFYTTKDSGVGLGLATVREMVARCGGWVDVHSRKGEGTAFDLYFPRCQAEIPGDTATAAARWEHPQTIGTTILVAEDEEQVAHLTKKVLERSGYQVLIAHSPHKALAILEDRTVRIDLLLSDVMMPEMTGRELRDLAMALRPSLPTLFMSGYTAETFSERGILETGVPFLAKPFTIGSLLEKVRAALDS